MGSPGKVGGDRERCGFADTVSHSCTEETMEERRENREFSGKSRKFVGNLDVIYTQISEDFLCEFLESPLKIEIYRRYRISFKVRIYLYT